MARRAGLVVAVASLITSTAVLLGTAYQQTPNRDGLFNPPPKQLAARWYYRARQGQLHYRSTTRGRSTSHTIRPGKAS